MIMSQPAAGRGAVGNGSKYAQLIDQFIGARNRRLPSARAAFDGSRFYRWMGFSTRA